jgi:DNA-binding response OmpR family regulator
MRPRDVPASLMRRLSHPQRRVRRRLTPPKDGVLLTVSRRGRPKVPSVLGHGDVALDSPRRRPLRAGGELGVRPKGLGVLELLLASSGRRMSAELLTRMWRKVGGPFTHTVKLVCSSAKLGDPPVIEMVAGDGYRI